MNRLKRLISLATVIAIVFSFTGCHKKNEIAVTVNDVEFTSAYYMCALINADSEAKNLVDEKLSESESDEDSEVDYYSQKIDDKKYVDWVEDRAIEMLTEVASYKILCKEKNLELDEEDIEAAKTTAETYWNSYGYGLYFEPNGVSLETYTKFLTDAFYSETYFDYIYGEDGEKAIDQQKIEDETKNNLALVNIIEIPYEDEIKDEDKKEHKEKLDEYVKNLKNGKMTFEDVYNDHNSIEEKSEDTTEDEHDHDEPKDAHATIVGTENTNYANDYIEYIKKMAVGDIKVIEHDNDTGVALVIKKDFKDDEYYKDTVDSEIRHLIADEDFEKLMNEYKKKLDIEINNYAVNQFKVKNIIEPEVSY